MKFTLRVRKFLKNPLFSRRQMVVEVSHPGAQLPTKTELRAMLGKIYHVKDESTIILQKFATKYGGSQSTGFCKIYDSKDDLLKNEPKFMHARMKLIEYERPSRKAIKGRKNAGKKTWGTHPRKKK
ncbi:Ribosomal protein S24e like protein [Aduncisulcus paluster]|uniref:Ribosomal protein S24e like protein n=1 Tax=Aduncisulcus paluster TaxID=2918883 RepID=A0ABQ5JZN4_9EUKA|nr:Ribosomal protein S24e like protein [Aduncisulcus paluster]|eukprot:gnl/Carplike_NY0171/194_a284_7057.p1 GENE.gnl/Carplike_NY0171/194_a284_7057~~gnl/Carplike_NY0171/194_a284_7057.p1  ORF type:complete len:126 (-),score=37.42 gnl/Carplike_NY0171/194_a284_7057:89-466(-)